MLIGIDLGGTSIKAGLVDFEGNILRQNSRPTRIEKGHMSIINDIAEQIEELAGAQGIPIEYIHSIGIGVPGLAEYDTGKVIYCSNLSWKNIELGRELYSRLGRKVYVENDATVAGLAESLFGSTKGAVNSVLITIGTGIGSGIIINGRIYSGSHAAGSEIGHMIVGENFYDCNCGNNGCFETLASATSIIRYSQHRIKDDGKNSQILELADNEIENITAEKIFAAAKSGDDLALEAVDRMCKYLAKGIMNIYNVLDPDIIAIGGGVSKAGDFLLKRVKENVARMIYTTDIKYGDIVIATLGNNAGIVGSAFLGYYINDQ
ncbi:ROK family glucokinase [Clostridium sp. HMP27]|uniref:ROK family protein n=1 Tax=Clostridium sp. HMP27 TaxID=1487921 RepID=UPI00052C1525|nr:ROK family glucokinase [Clostridium sp. HMP27]KGK90243.1 glucokinase [Clostridium sp. HMP27]